MTLIQKLRGKIKKASSNISSKFELNKGDFKICLTADSIDQFYKDNKVGSIKISQLDPELVELINTDEDAAHEMLEEFASTFDTSKVKEAANAAVDEETPTIITQKQLEDKKVKLHPRTDDLQNVITQRQLPNAGQRPGTYDEITQAQLTNERTTFYGDKRTSGDWKKEDRTTVTERQLDDDSSKYSPVAENNRGEMGAEFDGGYDNQQKVIGEKQLIELLSHHEWTSPMTITEGKDQLSQQKGELSRLTAENVITITKMALDALGKTVLSAGVTPNRLVNIISKLVSHPSKYPILADTITKFKGAPIDAINEKIANAKYFGKTANANQKYSDLLVADVFVRQIAASTYDPTNIVKVLAFLSKESSTFEKQIDEAVDKVITSASNSVNNFEDPDFEVIKAALSAPVVKGSADNDGMYMYVGNVSEINSDPKDQTKFSEAAAKYAETKIREATKVAGELVPFDCSIKEDGNTFEIRFQDKDFIKPALEVRAAKRRELAKEAQVPAGGMPPAGSPAMGNPTMPPGGTDMTGMSPPGEALSQTPPPPPAPTPETEESKGEPKPPGSTCPACGSSDVNVDSGDIKCNNCGTEGKLHVTIDITKWTGLIEDTDTEQKGVGVEEAGMGATETGMDSGAGAGEGTTLPSMPIAASIKITPLMLQKLAKQKIHFGKVCPNCGGSNVESIKSANYKGNDCICWDCTQEWNMQVKTQKGKKNSVYAQFAWIPKVAQESCSGCNRLNTAFKESLRNYGMNWEEFDKLSMTEQAQVIIKMAETNTLDIAEASHAPLPINKYAASARWKGFEQFDKFPSASCVERLSRRYGENATSMSGPCKGAKLAECVCSQLKTLGIYSDGLAAKVASAIGNPDPVINNPSETCMKMLMQSGLSLKEACIASDGLRAAYASTEDLIIEAITSIDPKEAGILSDLGGGVGNAVGGAAAGIGEGIGNAAAGIGQGVATVGNAATKPKALPEEPEESVVPETEITDIEQGEDMPLETDFDEFGVGDIDLGLEGDTITIELPSDMAETLKTLLDAIQGQISDDIIDTTEDIDAEIPSTEPDGDELVDVSIEQVDTGHPEPDGDELVEPTEPVSEETPSEKPDEELDIPGVEEAPDGGLQKESNPCKPCAMEKEPEAKENKKPEKEDASPKDLPFTDKSEPEEKDEDKEEAKEEKKDEDKEKEASSLRDMLYKMKTGTISKSASAMDNLVEGLLKQAKKSSDEIVKVKKFEEKSSKITAKPAQEASDIGKVQSGGTIGDETPFKDGVVTKVDVPRGDALMGAEEADKKLNDKENYPKVPHGKGLMSGEEHYPPQDGNVVDGNQGGLKAASHTMKHCQSCGCVMQEGSVCPKCNNDPGKKKIKSENTLKDNNTKISNSDNPMNKESQTAKLKNVKKLEDDPDLNPSSGPGKGKVKADETHSLAVDEKKPSEGMSEPSVPEDKNKGRLSREHTVDNTIEMPEIPTGGGMNPVYDQNEKNKPEKTDEILGKQNNVALAEQEHKNKATKIAGQLLKSNKITIDELPDKIAELLRASPAILADYEKFVEKEASETNKGMQKAAQSDAVENIPVQSITPNTSNKSNLKSNIEDLFTLQKRNKDFERFTNQFGQ